MILEGFEIENWSCIRKVSVTGLPPTGVIVLHGPNRRGKSSIVQALRAGLMDYSSSTKALTSWYPRGTSEKPVVSVTFRAGGTSYRIKKHFGSSKSELASRTTADAWKTETTSATDAHDRTCSLVGGNDSGKGLHQMLWLTQAEFRLPEAKKFDANVQAQLRGILGILQTPLDDRFLERVKKRWNTWYSGQRKSGKQQDIKSGCKLAEHIAKLETENKERQEAENKFKEIEDFLQKTIDLELSKRDLDRQLTDQTKALVVVREEHGRSHARIESRRHAESNFKTAEKELQAAEDEQKLRSDAASRLVDHEKAIEPAQKKLDGFQQKAQGLASRQVIERERLKTLREEKRSLRKRSDRIADALQALQDRESLNLAEGQLRDVQAIATEITALEQYLLDNPVPDKKSLDALGANRQQLAQLQAEQKAASIELSLVPEPGAASTRLSIDGGSQQEISSIASHQIRRKAELHIEGWGRIGIDRGASKVDLDQIDDDLKLCKNEFADAMAPFGISAIDPGAMDQIIQRNAARGLKAEELDKKKKQFKALASKGLAPFQSKVVELQTRLKDVATEEMSGDDPLPSERCELQSLAATVKKQFDAKEHEIELAEASDKVTQTDLAAVRQDESVAKADLAGCNAKAEVSRDELGRLQTESQIVTRVEEATAALATAQTSLKDTELTNEELTIVERLHAEEEAVVAIERQIVDVAEKYNRIKGRLEGSEGSHAQRSAIAARVEELERSIARDLLEKDAVDRLYALFEECREKQLGSVMTPIHDRVMNWLRVLDIGDYKEMRFNDAFLPDKLMTRDGTGEFSISEESTGAQEQIGMLVRLGLGSVLTSANDPAVAILDDPLTHCDIGRLNRMRVILRRIAEGDSTLTPPAGPMQIVILTCHPEWFRDDKATVIDLEDAAIMSRYST